MHLPSLNNPWLCNLAATVAGALLALAFAPLQWWPLAIVCPALLMLLIDSAATARAAAARGFWFNVGTFAAGTYGLFLGIHLEAPFYVALVLVVGLVGVMALYGALFGYCVARFLPRAGALRSMVGIPVAWLLIEWLRGWLLSGFAWLSLGYSQTDTWLAHLAPVVGVYGLTLVLVTAAGALVTLIRGSMRERAVAALVLVAPWIAAAPLGSVEWTHASGPAVGVAIVQGAVPEDRKWADTNRDATLALYRGLTERAFGAALIVLPEAALPDLAQSLEDYLARLYGAAHRRGSALVLGVLRVSDDGEQYYNSILSLGGGRVGWYDKTHLVPFAEFFPVPSFVRSWMRLMNLQYGDFTHGKMHQPLLAAGGLNLAPSICYEDAYGSMPLAQLGDTDALVNVTNDAWFAHSSARYEHFQIARMRALETGRYLLRAANDGVSAVIGPHGEVVARAPEYRPYVLFATVKPRRGVPPYAHTGNWLIISLGATTLAVLAAWMRRTGASGVRGIGRNLERDGSVYHKSHEDPSWRSLT